MKLKLLLIVLAAAAFGWGFSTLVERTDQTIRPQNAKLACQDWAGNGCARPTGR